MKYPTDPEIDTMKQSAKLRLILILLGVCGALLAPSFAAAQEPPSLIPHPVRYYRACLVCHETGLAQAPQIPEDHAGWANEICQDCHLTADDTKAVAPAKSSGAPSSIPHTLEGNEICIDCHSASGDAIIQLGGPAQIPHTLIGRENCLACHETGVGGVTKIPSDHEGRPNDVCQAQ